MDLKIINAISPLRANNNAVGEAQFQSALKVISTQNEDFIFAELERAINTNRTDYAFALEDLIGFNKFSQDLKLKVASLIQKHPAYNTFMEMSKAKTFYNEALNRINYQKSYLVIGKMNGNYSMNTLIQK